MASAELPFDVAAEGAENEAALLEVVREVFPGSQVLSEDEVLELEAL
jgi:hypothetical protein